MVSLRRTRGGPERTTRAIVAHGRRWGIESTDAGGVMQVRSREEGPNITHEAGTITADEQRPLNHEHDRDDIRPDGRTFTR
jgi:hypothetical protein